MPDDEIDNLAIVIDVIDSYSTELDELLLALTEVDAWAEKVDNIRIDVDVHDREIDELLAKLGLLEMADVAGGGDIDVNVGARGGGRKAAAVAVPDELGDLLTANFQAMSEVFSEQMEDLGRTTRRTSDNMKDMGETAEGLLGSIDALDLRMETVHNALAKIVPMLLVFIGALPALISALVALAGAAIAAGLALGALTGFAALGAAAEGGDIMKGFEDIISEIQDDFLDAFMPLADRLAPLFDDALEGLGRLFEEIAAEGDALVALQDEARGFGQWVIETLPGFLRDLALFAGAVSDAFGVIASADIDIFRILADIIERTLPALMVMGTELGKLLEHVIEMSIGFMQVANGILIALNVLLQFAEIVAFGNQNLGALIATILAVYGAAVILNSALFVTIKRFTVQLAGAIIKGIAYLRTWDVAAMKAASSTFLMSAAVTTLAAAIALTGIGALAVLFGAIASGANGAAAEIDQATASLRRFQKQQQDMNRRNPYFDPDLKRGDVREGRGGRGGNSVQVNVQGSADEKKTREQTHNGLYRMERTRRGR